jgi:hypothetical protein
MKIKMPAAAAAIADCLTSEPRCLLRNEQFMLFAFWSLTGLMSQSYQIKACLSGQLLLFLNISSIFIIINS